MSFKTNWLYLLLILITFSSCSKEEVSKSASANDYNLASYDLRQKGNTLVSGQKVKVQLLVKHYNTGPKKNNSAINKIEIVSGNSVVSSTSGFYLDAGHVDFKLVTLETSALKTGQNQFSVRIHYEAGFYDTGDFELTALKDRKLKTWWEGVSLAHLQSVKTTKTTAWPLFDGDKAGYTSISEYGNRDDEFLNIDGLYGRLLPFFDKVSLKIKYMDVAHGNFQFDPSLSLSAVRADILREFPDCVVTTDAAGVVTMTSLEFTFVIRNINNIGLVTRVTKN